MPLVHFYLNKKYPTTDPDIIQDGYLSLIEAIQKYNPRHNVTFQNFAKKYIYFRAIDSSKKKKEIVKNASQYDDFEEESLGFDLPGPALEDFDFGVTINKTPSLNQD